MRADCVSMNKFVTKRVQVVRNQHDCRGYMHIHPSEHVELLTDENCRDAQIKISSIFMLKEH
jgi:hypothetical protein